MLKNLLAMSVLGLAAATSASAVTINFENLAEGATLSNQYAAQGVTFSADPFSGAGSSTSLAAWATNTDMTIVSSIGTDVGGLGTPAVVSGNVLRSFDGWFVEDGDPSFLMSFSTPISSISVDFAGVSVSADVRLFIYNGASLLATVAGTSAASGNKQFTLSYSAASFTSVAVAPGSFDDWVGVDNIVFAPVPETSTYLMMALGLAALGLVARRRRAD